jgi:C_GCAxxG_C_C family probable redox protein
LKRWKSSRTYEGKRKTDDGEKQMKHLYLHGLGQKPDSWDRVIKETTVSDRSVSLSLAEMLEGKAATYGELYTAFSEECDKENDEIVLCGLSLGAVLALNYAIDHPDKVKALVLIAAQYKMPKKLLKFQNMLFRFMPNATIKQFGLKKADVISLCGTMAELDFRDSLCKVSCPVLIVCGEKDNANKKASKELAGYLSDSHFHELLKAGHEANTEAPEELAAVLQEFYDYDSSKKEDCKMNIGERAAQAAAWKATGQCNCAQAVLKAFEDKLPVDADTLMKLGAGYAAGMGCMESTCGALIGAVMVAGIVTDGKGTPRISKELLQNFQEKCGATICKDLKGIENGAPLCPCPECVRNAVLALGEVLGE